MELWDERTGTFFRVASALEEDAAQRDPHTGQRYVIAHGQRYALMAPAPVRTDVARQRAATRRRQLS